MTKQTLMLIAFHRRPRKEKTFRCCLLLKIFMENNFLWFFFLLLFISQIFLFNKILKYLTFYKY